jgi:hypothetical protein
LLHGEGSLWRHAILKKIKVFAIFIPVLVLMVAALACNLPVSVEKPVEMTVEAMTGEQVEMTVEAMTGEQTGEESESEEPAGEGAGETQTPDEEEAPPPDAIPSPTVSHQIYPSNPGNLDSWMTDRSSETLASERRAIGDNFDTHQLERPFTSQTMDYQAYLDIVRGELRASSPWIYITIFLEGSPPSDVEVAYGVEFDLDLDGRGDWFITGLVPSGSDWTTDNMRACRDTNNDVGGPTPVRSDPPHSARDGYDDCVFENGYGISPDEAWIRRDPGTSDRIQLALKHSLIGNDTELQWGPWADAGFKDPSLMDYNDALTLPDAGSPASESQYYPLNMLASVDNTCFWTFDFTPTQNYPRMCPLPPTPTPAPTPSPTPQPGRVSGFVWDDADQDDYKSGSEPYLAGVEVTLGSGPCLSPVIATRTTGSSGTFDFSGLQPGRYCLIAKQPDKYASTTPSLIEVYLSPGGHQQFRFGFVYIPQ